MKSTGIARAVLAAGALLALGARLGTAAPGRKGSAGQPGCIYGQVIDGHSGAVRCLSPEEISPPGPYDVPAEPADAGADAGAGRDGGPAAARRDAAVEASIAVPLRSAPFVSIEGLQFENGEVPHAAAALERIKKDLAKCAAPASSETVALKADAAVELRFLVRAPGKAEGVDVVQSRGVSADIVRCVTSSLAGRLVGPPTSDPVGVALTVRFKKD
jgi:hypothetical protein